MAKHIIELNKNDICKILSEKFNVKINNVQLDTYTDIEGYGMGEHEVIAVKASIIKDNFNYD